MSHPPAAPAIWRSGRELKRLRGIGTFEVEVLKEAVAVAREKKPTWQLPPSPRDASR